jgi:methyltransferase (TIGR00027 family)
VVLLGAGLDTRAWRLPLPPGTAVFEVDEPEMVAFKRDRLAACGAQVTAAAAVPVAARPGHPLRAASWAAVAADVAQPDWSAALIGQGFDRSA